MDAKQLQDTAKKIVSKVILAADESTPSIKKKFEKKGLKSTPEMNRKYRQLLFSTPGIEKYISGVILFDETFRQSADNGMSFPQFLESKGIVPGIKVDRGTKALPGQKPDTYTQGIDDLDNRLSEYKKLGARFAKWRAVYTISNGDHPSRTIIERNAHDLALYAALCQQNDIVPIVEPEVLMEGGHTIDDCKRVTKSVLREVFSKLNDYHVILNGMILKPNMVTAGKDSAHQASVHIVAESTLEILRSEVNSLVPGIAFLSGGQSPRTATEHLNEICKLNNESQKKFSRITASYGRALQDEAFDAWNGEERNIDKAQKAFLARAKSVYLASKGELAS